MKSWTIPRWWPLTKEGQAVVGFQLEFWFFPERDQWQLSCRKNLYGDRILSIGPLRLKVGPIEINRDFRDTGS